jgi:hypothetical protein
VALPPILLVPGLTLSGTATLTKPNGAASEAGARLSLYVDGKLASGVDLQ